MAQENVCQFNKFGFCKFQINCFRYHENGKCQNVQCSVRDCSFRHPRECRYFRDYGNCKFGEFCKFNHKAFRNENNIEIDEIKKKLEELKSQIDAKNKEINHKNSEIESMSKKVEHKIASIEEKMNVMEKNLNELRKENNVLKNMIASKEKESEENVDLEENFSKMENNLDCNKCDFIGKTESGLKVHKTAKHKVSEQGYRRVSKV